MMPLRQTGMGLAELMVAMAIGVVLTLFAFTLLLSASAGHAAVADGAHVDDAGRFALAAIERAARQSGLLDWEHDAAAWGDTASPPAVVGLDAASLSSDLPVLTDPRPPAVNGSDILALRFAGLADGSVTACAGFSVAGGRHGWSIFYVGLNGRREPELRCKYQGAGNWTADAVVGGVDSFQVLYGLDTDPVPDGVANRYASASDIIELDRHLPLESVDEAALARERMRKTHWKKVASIKVALMLHGSRAGLTAGPSAYDLFGAAYTRASSGRDQGAHVTRDGMPASLKQRERRLLTSTILLRNRAGAP